MTFLLYFPKHLIISVLYIRNIYPIPFFAPEEHHIYKNLNPIFLKAPEERNLYKFQRSDTTQGNQTNTHLYNRLQNSLTKIDIHS